MDWITTVGIIAFLVSISRSLPKEKIKFYLFLVLTFFSMMFSVILPLILFPFRPFDYRNALLACKVAPFFEWLLYFKYDLEGVEKIDRSKGAIIIINHQSFMDLLVLAKIWPYLGPTAVVSKKEILYFFPFGLAIWSWGTIFIDRSNPSKAIESLNRESKAIINENKKLLFFPEGTRSKSEKLLQFKKGPFITARETKCDIIPLVVSKMNLFDEKKKEYYGGTVTIKILDPIKSTDFDELKHLIDHCHETMQNEFDDLNKMEFTKL